MPNLSVSISKLAKSAFLGKCYVTRPATPFKSDFVA